MSLDVDGCTIAALSSSAASHEKSGKTSTNPRLPFWPFSVRKATLDSQTQWETSLPRAEAVERPVF